MTGLSKALLARLHSQRIAAWWHGTDAAPDEDINTIHDASASLAAMATLPDIALPESLYRGVLGQLVWGDGFMGPGKAEITLTGAQALGLTNQKSLIFLGAGLGACARVIAEDTGTWVTGLESDPVIAGAAAIGCKASMAKKKVAIESGEIEALAAKSKGTSALSHFALLTAPNWARLIGVVGTRISAGGGFLLIEYATKAGTEFQYQRNNQHFFGERDLAETLDANGFDIRVNEDLSSRYMPWIGAAWQEARHLPTYITSCPLSQKHKRRLLNTLESDCAMWAERLDLLGRSQIQIRRYLGFKRAEAIA